MPPLVRQQMFLFFDLISNLGGPMYALNLSKDLPLYGT